MTSEDYKATPEQWEVVGICREEGKVPWPTAACILELRARVEALEAAENYRQQDQDAERAAEPAPAGSLVERMGAAILKQFESNAGNEAEARAAIREVAAWLKEQAPGFLTGDELIEAAHLISREAGQ